VRFITSYAEWVGRGIHNEASAKHWSVQLPTLIPRLLPEREKEPEPDDHAGKSRKKKPQRVAAGFVGMVGLKRSL
jgi:hypothetical protein